MKRRWRVFASEHKSFLQGVIIFAALGLVYYALILFTPIRIPCVWYDVTGWYCAGCGLSRFCIALLQGDLMGAMHQNLGAAFVIIECGVLGVIEFIWNPRWLAKGSRGLKWIQATSYIIILFFGLLRNFPEFSFLAPVPACCG